MIQQQAHQAHQLFIEEALELMQQLQVDLSELSVNPTANLFDRLLEAIQIVNGGASEVNLSDLQIPIERFETMLLSIEDKSSEIAPDRLANLREIYDEIWESLFPYLPTYQSELETPAIALGDETNEVAIESSQSLTTSKNHRLQMDLLEVTIQKDLPLALERLEKVLNNSFDADRLVKEILTVVEFIFKLSETWQDYDLTGKYFEFWSSLTETSQSTLTLLTANSQSAEEIGYSALSSWRNAYQLAIEKYFSLKEDGNKEPSGAIEETLSTAKSFLWLSGFNLFVLPSESIQKIVNLNPESIIISNNRRFLLWQQQEIPLYKISELLSYQSLIPNTAIDLTATKSLKFKDQSWQTLIVNLGEEMVAIEPEVDRIIVKSKLQIKPFNKILATPNYFYGCTFLEDELPKPVINVKILLDFYLETNQNISIISPVILVVDDSKMMREMIGCTLEQEGYQIIKAKNGREAIDRLEENQQIQGIICDLEMPIISGFAFLKYRSTHPNFGHLPVLILTSHNSEQNRQLALQLGATDYLTIPYQESELLAILKQELETNKSA